MEAAVPNDETVESLRKAADALSQRVVAWEEWLNGLPGRVATEIGTPRGGVLRFERVKGKTWALIAVIDGEDVRLRDAPLMVKVEALGCVEALLNAMLASQKALISKIQEATAKFDAVFKDVKGAKA